MSLTFKPEDFQAWREAHPAADMCGIMAGLAQRIFDEWLEKQPVIEYPNCDYSWETKNGKAVLEPLEKKKGYFIELK